VTGLFQGTLVHKDRSLKISIVMKDITQEKTDAITNAANEYL
jgi:hypothetical protein